MSDNTVKEENPSELFISYINRHFSEVEVEAVDAISYLFKISCSEKFISLQMLYLRLGSIARYNESTLGN